MKTRFINLYVGIVQALNRRIAQVAPIWRLAGISVAILLGITLLLFASCSHEKQPVSEAVETTTVALKPETKTLYFNSNVRPVTSFPINSKVDGIIAKKYFKYGTVVAKDQLLFVISSPQLITDYQAALTDYLKALRDYSDNQQKMVGNNELQKQGLISAQDFHAAQTTLFYSELSLAQSKRKFQDILGKLDIPPATIEMLNLNNPKSINEMLSRTTDTLNIYSPATGVGLAPEKGGGEGGGTLTVGSQVKQGQTLVVVGEEEGLGFDIKVSEINIDAVNIGQQATITGDGFPQFTLHGVVVYKERQPVSGESGGLTSYMVHVVVPKITDQEKAKIRDGMSAQVELPVVRQSVMKIPLSAVYTENGQSMVKVLDKKTNTTKNVQVNTGPTTSDSIEITQGLSPGDVVLNNPNPTPKV